MNEKTLIVHHVHECECHHRRHNNKPARRPQTLPQRREESDSTGALVKAGIIGGVTATLGLILLAALLDE